LLNDDLKAIQKIVQVLPPGPFFFWFATLKREADFSLKNCLGFCPGLILAANQRA